jgi:hypothetical protein
MQHKLAADQADHPPAYAGVAAVGGVMEPRRLLMRFNSRIVRVIGANQYTLWDRHRNIGNTRVIVRSRRVRQSKKTIETYSIGWQKPGRTWP